VLYGSGSSSSTALLTEDVVDEMVVSSTSQASSVVDETVRSSTPQSMDIETTSPAVADTSTNSTLIREVVDLTCV
jgi:polyhydroxyalkanoate synthesis regulator phasin